MGVDRQDYLIIGYKMPYDVKMKDGRELSDIVWEDEKYLPFIEGWKDEEYRLIIDGMSGEYIVFGYPLDESDEYGGFNFNVIDIKQLQPRIDTTINTAIVWFSDVDFDFKNPEIFCFSHYH
jgi:hypothetical protein